MYSFIVSNEECPKCGHDTHKQDAIHIEVIDGHGTWTTASANAPCGTVTEDEMSDTDPSEEDCPDLILDNKNVKITCVKCGQPLDFTYEKEND